MIKLRDYQIDAIETTYQWMRDNPGKNPVVVAPTGSGKAVLIAQMCKDAYRFSRRAIVLAHVKELLQQEADKLQNFCPEVRFGVYSAGLNSRDTDSPILVAGIQSVYKKAAELGGFNLVLIDEAHRVSTREVGMYRSFLADLQRINPQTRCVGFTATPYRTGEGSICKTSSEALENQTKLFDDISYNIEIEPLIQQGFLSPPVSRSGVEESLADFDQAHIARGDFVTHEVEELAMDFPIVYSACKDFVSQTADRKSVIVFCVSVYHALKVYKILTVSLGVPCAMITGETPAEERDRIQQEFREQKIKYLINVDVLTTGFDAPGIDAVVLLRPTASPVLYVQMVGRGFRIAPGKENCLVLDYGGNVMRHGPVTAVNVKDGSPQKINKKERAKNGGPAVKPCPNCLTFIERYRMVCPYCDYAFPIHETTSSDADILGKEVKAETYDVRSVRYRVWEKRDDPEAPHTVRVDYEIGWGKFVSEWVCPEHWQYDDRRQFAFKRFIDWWEQRSYVEPPETADEAVAIAEAGGLAEPESIVVRKKPGDQFPTIVSAKLGAIPENVPSAPASTYGNFNQFSDDEF